MNKIPPSSDEAEMTVLGSMIIDTDNVCRYEVLNLLQARHFFVHQHQVIFAAIETILGRQEGLDSVILRDELKKNATIMQEMGGLDYIVRLMGSTVSLANTLYHAKIIKEKYELRQLIALSQETQARSYDPNADIATLLETLQTKLFNISAPRIGQRAEESMSVLAPVVSNEILARRPGSLSGLKTGYVKLDEKLGGLHNGNIVIIAGRTSMGKTALGMNIAENVALKSNTSVLVFSLEMDKKDLVERMITGRAHVDSYSARTGYLSASDRQDIAISSMELEQTHIIIDDRVDLTPAAIRGQAMRYKHLGNIGLVVVDYLQQIKLPGSRSRLDQVTTISLELKAMARDLDIPVIVLSQLNRLADHRDDNRPRLSDLRESGSIEQDADVVLLL